MFPDSRSERTARRPRFVRALALLLLGGAALPLLRAQMGNATREIPVSSTVEGQPLGAEAERLIQALAFLGHPLPEKTVAEVLLASRQHDAAAIQRWLDPQVLLVVQINPELRVRASRGPAPAVLQQNGFTPVVVKILNDGGVSQRLRITSPQSGPVYAVDTGASALQRMQLTDLVANQNVNGDPGRFLQVEMFASPPMTDYLSGLEAEYAIALISSTEAGKREATIGFDIGQGTQDLGFRGEIPILFEVKPAVPVRLTIHDYDGSPTVAQLVIRDSQGNIYPTQAKRLAPDLFFERQIYRADGSVVMLPPGTFSLTYDRGPEYRVQERTITVPSAGGSALDLKLERWINPAQYGYYSGDHHIHAAGCAHYDVPTIGIGPNDLLLQVKGEGLNVGGILSWAAGFEHQAQFFSSSPDPVSEPQTVLKWDIEISGFGSAAMGHLVLLDLKSRNYPGSNGTTQGWPTWTVPAMRWAKAQGGVAGCPHSDMRVDPLDYAKRYVRLHDRNGDGRLDRQEAEGGLLPLPFDQIDTDKGGYLTVAMLEAAADRAANRLPNLVLPSMRGFGAMEIFVSAVEGVCDFISAMDTGRVGEWNTWYHLLNCGFSLSVAGETDFPCMSGTRVGQGRTYVKMAKEPISEVNYTQWCRGLAEGRSYVSDGYAHAINFAVNGVEAGTGRVNLSAPGVVTVRAKVAFAPEVPAEFSHGTLDVPGVPRRLIGTTIERYGPSSDARVKGGDRVVEIVENGKVVARQTVLADGALHELSFQVPVGRSSWIALRQFPQLHTNPVDVIVGGKPIRVSPEDAEWCAESVELLWENRSHLISPAERPAARAAYDRAIAEFRRRALESRSASVRRPGG